MILSKHNFRPSQIHQRTEQNIEWNDTNKDPPKKNSSFSFSHKYLISGRGFTSISQIASKGNPSSMSKNIGLVTRIIFCFIRRVIPEWIWWNKNTIHSSYKIFMCELINHLIKERGKRRWKSPKRKSKRTRENRTTENTTYFWSIVKYENIELIYSNLKIEYK